VDYVARRRLRDSPAGFVIADTVYTVLFSAELLLRACAEGRTFFDKESWMWNVFDVFIIIMSLMDAVFGAININVTHTRIIRVMRCLRTMRLIRLIRFILALRTLLHSIIATLKSLIWSILLLVMVFYGFALAFTQGVNDLVTVEPEPLVERPSTDCRPPARVELLRFWGTVPRSMFTLFKSLSGGVSWDEVVTPLAEAGWFYVALFVIFIVFTFFAVLNVITGVFCQTAIESAYVDKELMTMHMLANKKKYMEAFTQLFKEIDADHSGVMNLEEFEEYMTNEKCRAYLHSVDIDPADAWTLFKLLDADGGGSIDVEEFVYGCLSLRGNAKAIQIAKLEHESRLSLRMLASCMESLDAQLEALAQWAGVELPQSSENRLGKSPSLKP